MAYMVSTCQNGLHDYNIDLVKFKSRAYITDHHIRVAVRRTLVPSWVAIVVPNTVKIQYLPFFC